LPTGKWYDWLTGKGMTGGRTVQRTVDLTTMPIYVRAGAIIPFDPIRQYTNQVVDEPCPSGKPAKSLLAWRPGREE